MEPVIGLQGPVSAWRVSTVLCVNTVVLWVFTAYSVHTPVIAGMVLLVIPAQAIASAHLVTKVTTVKKLVMLVTLGKDVRKLATVKASVHAILEQGGASAHRVEQEIDVKQNVE